MTERVDCVVIGAGVIGLAIGRALALRGRETIVIEACSTIGTGASSRNSEIIHAGIYYPTGSLKSRLCVDGRQMLYPYCEAHGVAARRCGKLIVATSVDQLASLATIQANAIDNGVGDLCRLTADEAHAMEPALFCVGALFSPETGIVDSHALMLALQGDLERAGGTIALGSTLRNAAVGTNYLRLRIGRTHIDPHIDPQIGPQIEPTSTVLDACTVINSAGLHAQAVAGAMDGFPPEAIPPLYLAKGNYYTLNARSPFHRLIYPVPEAAGLGVHLTLDLGGRARFGPDVEWVDRIDYSVDAARADAFYSSIRRYWPDLPDGALQPGYAGIRPKLQKPGEAARDFLIQGPKVHGIAGLVNLFGIESPGLTASLAIAEHVAALV